MRKRKKLLTTAAAALAVVTVYTYIAIHTEDWIVESDRIPAAFDGLRIALLADFHGVELGEDNRRLLEAVARSNPDIIAVTGDLVHQDSDLAVLPKLISGLTAIAPTYFVTGNHDWTISDPEGMLRQLEELGVTVLQNDYRVLERNGQQLVIAGVDDPNAYADMERPAHLVDRIREEVGGDPYLIMLAHRNDMMTLWAPTKTDLVLCGHGHGGVVRLPVVGGLLSVNRTFFPQDAEGLRSQDRTTIAVTRGVGGVRLWNRPHLPTIVLKKP